MSVLRCIGAICFALMLNVAATSASASQPVEKNGSETTDSCSSLIKRNTAECLPFVSVEKATDSARWAFWSLVMSGLTVAAVVLGFQQNEQAQRKEFRAYLRLDRPKISFLPNGCLKIDFEFVNYGRTPATSVSGTGTAKVVFLRAGTLMGNKNTKFSLDAVHPGRTYQRTEVTEGGYDVSAQEHVDAKQARVSLTVKLRYRDVYGKFHEEPFTFNYIGTDETKLLVPDFSE